MKHGGPAFPTESEHQASLHTMHFEGMTLRDYFAAQFMERAQILSESNSGWDAQTAAQCAYMMADAMLAERK